jgi:hypothetical protein
MKSRDFVLLSGMQPAEINNSPARGGSAPSKAACNYPFPFGRDNMAVNPSSPAAPVLHVCLGRITDSPQHFESFLAAKHAKDFMKVQTLKQRKLIIRHTRFFEQVKDIANPGFSPRPQCRLEYRFPSPRDVQFKGNTRGYGGRVLGNAALYGTIQHIRECKKSLVGFFRRLPFKKNDNFMNSGISVSHICQSLTIPQREAANDWNLFKSKNDKKEPSYPRRRVSGHPE